MTDLVIRIDLETFQAAGRAARMAPHPMGSPEEFISAAVTDALWTRSVFSAESSRAAVQAITARISMKPEAMSFLEKLARKGNIDPATYVVSAIDRGLAIVGRTTGSKPLADRTTAASGRPGEDDPSVRHFLTISGVFLGVIAAGVAAGPKGSDRTALDAYEQGNDTLLRTMAVAAAFPAQDRQAAMMQMGLSGGKQEGKALVKALGDSSPEIRSGAAKALGDWEARKQDPETAKVVRDTLQVFGSRPVSLGAAGPAY